MLGIITEATLKLLRCPLFAQPWRLGSRRSNKDRRRRSEKFSHGIFRLRTGNCRRLHTRLRAETDRQQTPEWVHNAHIILEPTGSAIQCGANFASWKKFCARGSHCSFSSAFGAVKCEKIWHCAASFPYSLRDTGLTKLTKNCGAARENSKNCSPRSSTPA